jgi:preprotein translocase subunit SecF
MDIPNIYKGDYRILLAPPLLLILVSLLFIPNIKPGVDFRGGTLITLSMNQSIDAAVLQAQLMDEGLDAKVRAFQTPMGYKAEIEVPQSPDLVLAEELKGNFSSLMAEVSRLEVLSYQNSSYEANYTARKAELDALADRMFALAKTNRSNLTINGLNDLEKRTSESYSRVYLLYQESISKPINRHVSYQSISVQSVSPVLSTHFIEKALNVVVFSAVLSIILVFLFFRSIVPSIAVLTGALSDVIIAMGAMGLFGIPLTLQSFAALLMLIGFSLDTDILLTTRILKRKGDLRENAFDAMKTGLTMSVMAIVAFASLFVLSLVMHIPAYYEISAVALAGLVGDMFATWGINGVMILWYAERRKAA